MIFGVPRQLIARISMDKTDSGIIGALIACVLCCSSCGVPLPFEMPFTKYNAVLSWNPPEKYNFDFKGWSHKSQGGRLAVLHWQGSGELCAEARTIILCLRDAGQESSVPYRLAKGILIPTGRGKIGHIQVLDNESFSCELLAGRRLRLSYDGRVASGPTPAYLYEPRYLRFSVVSKEDDRRALPILRGLYPQLREREEAREVVTCIAPFVENAGTP